MTGRRLLLVGLLALGIFLRAWGLGAHALWTDEYGTWWVAAGTGWTHVWQRAVAVQGQSPLYYLVARAMLELFGASPLALRLPSFLCGVALVALAYPLARAVFRCEWTALVAVATFAVSERLIYYSQDARPYALALLCAGASCLFYLSSLRGRRGAAPAHMAATALAFYAHSLFGLILVVQGVHFLLQRPRPSLRPWLIRAGVLALLLAPGLGQLAALHARRRGLDWVPPTETFASGLTLVATLLDPWLLLALVASVGVAAAVAREFSRPAREATPSLVALWLLVPVIALDLGSRLGGVTLLHLRYAAVALPAVALAHAFVVGLGPRLSRLRFVALAVYGVAVLLFRLLPHLESEGVFSDRYTDHRWDLAVPALARDYREGDLVLYSTHLVELDAVVAGEASPEIASFAEWPLVANLPEGLDVARRPLPFGKTLEDRRRLERIFRDSQRAPRVWLVGHPSMIQPLVRAAERQPGVRIERRERYGQVFLILLVRER